MKSKLICGDCLEVLPTLPKAVMIFADPPDNLKIKYKGFTDKRTDYISWLWNVMYTGTTSSSIFWLSYNAQYQQQVLLQAWKAGTLRQFIWYYTFGQHNKYDCTSSYRPILRVMQEDAILYPDAIRVPSARQTKYNDKRANPAGRVPNDVWEFPRVCGTFHERRRWFPNQHPEALIERIVNFSTKKGDLVIDMFAGSGTVSRVCHRLNRPCISIEISKHYCTHIRKEQPWLD